MFEEDFKKKSKITVGTIILLGIIFMSIVVLLNNTFYTSENNDSVKITEKIK